MQEHRRTVVVPRTDHPAWAAMFPLDFAQKVGFELNLSGFDPRNSTILHSLLNFWAKPARFQRLSCGLWGVRTELPYQL